MVVYKITASLGGGGVLDYEVCMSIDNNSNNPSVGSSANSYTANGKRYDFRDAKYTRAPAVVELPRLFTYAPSRVRKGSGKSGFSRPALLY